MGLEVSFHPIRPERRLEAWGAYVHLQQLVWAWEHEQLHRHPLQALQLRCRILGGPFLNSCSSERAPAQKLLRCRSWTRWTAGPACMLTLACSTVCLSMCSGERTFLLPVRTDTD